MHPLLSTSTSRKTFLMSASDITTFFKKDQKLQKVLSNWEGLIVECPKDRFHSIMEEVDEIHAVYIPFYSTFSSWAPPTPWWSQRTEWCPVSPPLHSPSPWRAAPLRYSPGQGSSLWGPLQHRWWGSDRIPQHPVSQTFPGQDESSHFIMLSALYFKLFWVKLLSLTSTIIGSTMSGAMLQYFKLRISISTPLRVPHSSDSGNNKQTL